MAERFFPWTMPAPPMNIITQKGIAVTPLYETVTPQYSEVHSAFDGQMGLDFMYDPEQPAQTRKWKTQYDPLRHESQLRNMQPTSNVRESYRAAYLAEKTGAEPSHRPGKWLIPNGKEYDAEAARVFSKQEKKQAYRQAYKAADEAFAKEFRAWIAKRGRVTDHVNAGWWPTQNGVPTADPGTFMKQPGFLSKHPSVTSYINGFMDAKIDFMTGIAKLKAEADIAGVDDWPVEKLWLFYKYVVRGCRDPDQIEADMPMFGKLQGLPADKEYWHKEKEVTSPQNPQQAPRRRQPPAEASAPGTRYINDSNNPAMDDTEKTPENIWDAMNAAAYDTPPNVTPPPEKTSIQNLKERKEQLTAEEAADLEDIDLDSLPDADVQNYNSLVYDWVNNGNKRALRQARSLRQNWKQRFPPGGQPPATPTPRTSPTKQRPEATVAPLSSTVDPASAFDWERVSPVYWNEYRDAKTDTEKQQKLQAAKQAAEAEKIQAERTHEKIQEIAQRISEHNPAYARDANIPRHMGHLQKDYNNYMSSLKKEHKTAYEYNVYNQIRKWYGAGTLEGVLQKARSGDFGSAQVKEQPAPVDSERILSQLERQRGISRHDVPGLHDLGIGETMTPAMASQVEKKFKEAAVGKVPAAPAPAPEAAPKQVPVKLPESFSPGSPQPQGPAQRVANRAAAKRHEEGTEKKHELQELEELKRIYQLWLDADPALDKATYRRGQALVKKYQWDPMEEHDNSLWREARRQNPEYLENMKGLTLTERRILKEYSELTAKEVRTPEDIHRRRELISLMRMRRSGIPGNTL